MALMRTALESALRVNWLLDIYISEDLRLARVAATALEALLEVRKMNDSVPAEVDEEGRLAASLDARIESLSRWCADNGLAVDTKQRRGKVTTSAGDFAVYPLGIFDEANRWWKPVGGYTYRWLSAYVHASPTAADHVPAPIAALRIEDVYVMFSCLTEAVWTAMHKYARWVGLPDNLMKFMMRRVRQRCRKSIDVPLLKRSPDPGEAEYVEMLLLVKRGPAATAADRQKIIRKYTRRIDWD
jgi:hypothetical protein